MVKAGERLSGLRVPVFHRKIMNGNTFLAEAKGREGERHEGG
jgi:hypothetical protein